MMLAPILLALALSLLLATGAWLAERLLRPVGVPTRFVWITAMWLTVGLVAVAPLRAVATPVAADPHQLGALTILGVDDALSAIARSAQHRLPIWTDALLRFGWLAGVAVALTAMTAGLVRQRQVLARSTAAVVGGVPVRVSDEFGPAVIGIVAPEIVLPRWLLGRRAEEQALVVAHERAHIAVRDPALLVLGAALAVLIPWDPLMWWSLSRLRLAMELDCDARVLRAGAAPLTYGSLLLDLTAALPPSRVRATAFAARPSQLEARILAMSVPPVTTRRRNGAILAAVCTGIAAVAIACSAEVHDTPTATAASGTESARTAPAAASPVDARAPYFDFQVERPAAPAPGSGFPRYPADLRSAGVEGEVLAQFVVDATGRVEIASYKTVRTTHETFDAAVRAALPTMRFKPAELGGAHVRQLVQQPFVFQLAR